MKKILFLLLSTVSIYGQVSTGQEQEFDYGIKNNSAQTVTTANHLTTTGADGTQGKILPSSLPISTAVANALDLKVENSAGAIQGFAITDNGNGTVNIATGTAYLRTTNDPYSPLIKYVIPAVTNLALTDNANNFVLVDYNGGTPALTVSLSAGTVNTMTNSIAYVISRVGTSLDYVSLIGQNVDANGKLRRRFLNSEGLKRSSGAVLSGLNRNLVLTAGLYYSGLTELTTPAFNTSTGGTFTQAYLNGGNWVRTTGNTQINNTQYSLAGVLTTMPSNDYRVDYVFILADNPSKLYVLLGNTTYNNIASARLAPVPSDLVSELQYLGGRVGRIIIQKDATIMEVSSEFATIYQAGSAQLHNDLGGLNAGDFQHLTVAEKANIAPLASPSFTGVPTSPTATAGTNTTQIATTAFVTNADSNNVKLTGNQTILGTKTFSFASFNKIYIQPSLAGNVVELVNTLGGNGISGRNSSGGNFINIESTGTGKGIGMVNGSTGIEIFNTGTGIGNVWNKGGTAIGDFLRISNDGALLSKINSLGELTSPKITVSNLAGTGTRTVVASATGELSTISDGITGTGTTNYIPKFTSSGVIGNSIVFDNGTNVGIGTTSPTAKLEVNGDAIFSGKITTGPGAGDVGGYFLPFFSPQPTSRSYRIKNDTFSFGDFTIQQSTDQTVTSYNTRFRINENGVVEIPNLSGTGTRTVVASSTGQLTAVSNIDYRNYKVYTALLSQTGTNAPVATVLENTLGGVIVWSRDGDVAGHYTGTLTGVFLTDPFYLTNNFGAANAPINVEIQRINNNSILLWTRIGTSTADGLLNGKTSIEIRVYN